MMLDEKPEPPHDFDVEFALLGWILSDNKTMGLIGDLTAIDFYSAAHADIFQAVETLYRDGRPITPFTIKPLLKYPNDYELTGDFYKYISGSFSHSLLFPNPAEQAKHLLSLSKRRHILTACEQVVESQDPSFESQTATLTKALTQGGSIIEIFNNYEITEQIINDLKDDRKPFPTGLKCLDEAMDGGLYPGKSYGFAGRKKMGKTAFAATISANLNAAGARHLFICGEMSAKEIHQRVLARLSNSFPSAFRNEYGQSPHFAITMADLAIKTPKNTLYADAPGLTFDKLRALISTAVEIHHVSGFILDYWQLVGGKGKSQSNAEHLDEVAQWIADISRKSGIWSITMAQINQEGNTRGGEGIRLAFDQVYQLCAPDDDPTRSGRWLEMMDTRYTKWANVGNESTPLLTLNEKGPYFEES